MAGSMIIYGKAGWPYTDKARAEHGNAVYYDVKKDPVRLEEMLKHSGGQRKVPVLVDGDRVSVGYGGSWGVWAIPTVSG